MKQIAILGCAALKASAAFAETTKSVGCQCACACACACAQAVDKGIAAAVGYYIEGGRKGDSKITRKAFAPNATMSWSDKGKVTTVPIKALYDYVDKSGAMTVTHGEIKGVASTPTTALVSVDTQFGKDKYTDTFALVRDGEAWKIVAKIYHAK